MEINNIPAELRKREQWVFYKEDKRPWDAHNNRPASSTDPSTWSTFEVACQAVKDYKGKGVGFVFAEDGEYVGVDLDKVIDDDGKIDEEAQAIIDRFDSYTEVSRSGHGIHIIGRGKKPTSKCRRGNVEIYEKSRYFCITANLWQERSTVSNIQKALDWLCETALGKDKPTTDGETQTEWAEVTLSADAEPPKDKLEALLDSNAAFKTAWNHRMKPSPKSLSEYEFKLACLAMEDGWSDQEIADLLIPYRIKWGDEGGLKKALRKDYIPRTITEARERTKDGAVLKLLPFTVVKVLQYGVADSDIALVLEDGREINVGKTELFLNLTRTKARLWEQGYALSTQAQKHWDKITGELVKLREIVKTATANDVTRGWLLDYARGLQHLPVVSDENPLEKIFASLNWNARSAQWPWTRLLIERKPVLLLLCILSSDTVITGPIGPSARATIAASTSMPYMEPFTVMVEDRTFTFAPNTAMSVDVERMLTEAYASRAGEPRPAIRRRSPRTAAAAPR